MQTFSQLGFIDYVSAGGLLRPTPSPSGSLAVARPASPCSAIAPHVLSWLASSPVASHGSTTGWPTSASHDLSTRCIADAT